MGFLRFFRKMFYRAASVMGRRGDLNYFFLGAECKVDYCRTLSDAIIWFALGRDDSRIAEFSRLIDSAAAFPPGDETLFRFSFAVSGENQMRGTSDEALEYLLRAAFRRGQSLRECREARRILFLPSMKVFRNSIYGFSRNRKQIGV